jgi:hypothetical protein
VVESVEAYTREHSLEPATIIPLAIKAMEHQLDEFSEAGAHLMEDPDSFTLPLISYRPDIEPTERLEDANIRDRALDLAIAEINEKTDVNIERAKYRRVTGLVFAIKTLISKGPGSDV